jgi:hypothetical protein
MASKTKRERAEARMKELGLTDLIYQSKGHEDMPQESGEVVGGKAKFPQEEKSLSTEEIDEIVLDKKNSKQDILKKLGLDATAD